MKKLILLVATLILAGCTSETELKQQATDVSQYYYMPPEMEGKCKVLRISGREGYSDIKAVVCSGKLEAVTNTRQSGKTTVTDTIILNGVEYIQKEKK